MMKKEREEKKICFNDEEFFTFVCLEEVESLAVGDRKSSSDITCEEPEKPNQTITDLEVEVQKCLQNFVLFNSLTCSTLCDIPW